MSMMLASLIAAASEAAAPAASAAAPPPARPLAALVTPFAGAPVDRAAPAGPKPASPKPDRAQVLAAVKAEWGRYDGGAKGRLTPLEFSTWVLRANGLAVASGSAAPRRSQAIADKGIRPVPAMNATAAAFARADANHDGGVTPEEMANFLLR